MHIFVTGGSGQTGPAIVSELVANGHKVTGLARSEKSIERLVELGAQTLHGSVDDLEVLAEGAGAADGVILMAFGGDFSDPEGMTRRDCAAIEAMGGALTGSGRPLVITSGTLVMPTDKVATEQDAPDPQSLGTLRIPGEQACLGFANQGVRSIVLRLAPTVHGPGDYGFIPFLSRPRGAPASPLMLPMARIGGPQSTATMQQPCIDLPSKRRRQAACYTVQERAASPSRPSQT